ncbi:MAG: helix-turn-helix transcriptional regulator [Rhodospirillaceae bacterium]|nr:helix-turn-helix transcriptional regulator [Rhodospirillaceae bacterium]
MEARQVKAWRKALGLSQKEAAEALGLKRRIFQYYEKGERDGEAVKVPKTVRLACWALTQGVVDYVGPDLPDDKKKTAKKSDKLEKVEDVAPLVMVVAECVPALAPSPDPVASVVASKPSPVRRRVSAKPTTPTTPKVVAKAPVKPKAPPVKA